MQFQYLSGFQSFRDTAGAILPEVTVKRSIQDIASSDADGVSSAPRLREYV